MENPLSLKHMSLAKTFYGIDVLQFLHRQFFFKIVIEILAKFENETF